MINKDSLNIYFYDDNYLIGKNELDDLYYVDNDKSVLLAKKYEINVIDKIDNYVFILGDKIKVYDCLDLSKPYEFYSSYYNCYYKAEKHNDVYLVTTDDTDLIIVYKKNNNILFKRVLEYELDKIDEIISRL